MTTGDCTRDEHVSQYDWHSVAPATAIVETVAEVKQVPPRELDALYDYLDPDALNSLLDGATPSPTHMELTFDFESHQVTVRGDGKVRVRRV